MNRLRLPNPVATRTRLTAVAATTLLVAGLLVSLVWGERQLGALVGIVVPVGFTIVVLVGTRRAGIALVFAGVSLAALNGLLIRPGDAPIERDEMLVITLADPVMVAGTILLLPSLRRGPGWRLAAPLYGAILLIIAGGLAGTAWASPDVRRSLINIAQFAVAAAGTLTLIVLWSPTTREIRVAVAVFTATVLASAGYGFLLDVSHLDRVKGLALQPNHLALMSVFATGTALAQRATSGRRLGWAMMAVVGSLELIILYTGSRASLLGFIAVVAIFATLWRPITALAPAAVLAAFAAASHVEWFNIPESNALSRLLGGGGTSRSIVEAPLGDRESLFSTTWQQILDSPIFGHGFHDVLHPHSVYLELWGGGGLLALGGVLLFAAIVGSWLWRGFSLFRDPLSPEAMLLFGLAAGTAGYLVVAATQPYLWERYIWLAPALAVATLPRIRSQSLP